MDKMPPELLLKIAGYCDFAGVCAMSKVNRRCNDVIESNWNSLKKTSVGIWLFEDKDDKNILCEVRGKVIEFKVTQCSENVNASEVLESVLKSSRHHKKLVVRPMGSDEFLEDLFTPIFRRSTLHNLLLKWLKSSTLQVMIALLDRFRPTVGNLDITIGSKDGHSYHHDVQELVDSARIVELSKPDILRLSFSYRFAKEETRELFLKKIANLYIPRVDISCGDWANVSYDNPETNRPSMHGPLPKCRNLTCTGSSLHGISALEVPDIVDIVEEWSNNERDIEYYELNYFAKDIRIVATQFKQALKERNLPVRFEVAQKNAEFLMEKIVKRGDSQDQLRFEFYEDDEYSSNDSDSDDDFIHNNFIFISTNEGNA